MKLGKLAKAAGEMQKSGVITHPSFSPTEPTISNKSPAINSKNPRVESTLLVAFRDLSIMSKYPFEFFSSLLFLLQVTLLRAKGIAAADLNGKSDPFIRAYERTGAKNGQRFFLLTPCHY